MNAKLHAACDDHGQPRVMLLSEGQVSRYKGAALMLHAFPKDKSPLGDRGYDTDWVRQALADRNIVACMPNPGPRNTSEVTVAWG